MNLWKICRELWAAFSWLHIDRVAVVFHRYNKKPGFIKHGEFFGLLNDYHPAIFALLGWCAAEICCYLRTFRGNLSVPSSREKLSGNHLLNKIRWVGCFIQTEDKTFVHWTFSVQFLITMFCLLENQTDETSCCFKWKWRHWLLNTGLPRVIFLHASLSRRHECREWRLLDMGTTFLSFST
jgi:hypothetical protein